MTVRKYRSVAEMPGVQPRTPLDPDNLRIACELTELAYALHPWHLEPGVRKFRSMEEANRYREERERRQVRRSAVRRGLEAVGSLDEESAQRLEEDARRIRGTWR